MAIELVGVEAGAFGLGGDERGDEVVGRSGAADGDVGLEEGGEVAGGGVGGVLDRAVAAGLVHGDHGVRPGEEVGRGLLRDAEEAGDDADRQRLGEGGDEVESVREGVDELGGDGGDVGGEAGDAAGGEGAQDEAAQAGVAGRLAVEHRAVVEAVEVGKVSRALGFQRFGQLAAEAAVAEEGRDLGVAGGAGEAVVLPEEERAGAAGAVVEGVGVLDEGRVAGGLA